MHSKLTLRLDNELIKQAKAWAKSRRISLSQAVGEFFSQLRGQDSTSDLSPWTRRLIGAARGKGKVLTDERIHRDYLRYLESKHR
ncbi:MAG: DUF6364 family protein [Candidatus Binatia bacterium]